jgi:hypothetical protein
MKSFKRYDIKVKQALKAAYNAKENHGPKIGEQFEAQVMRRVRALGPIHSRPDYLSLFEQFFWRLVPVTAVLIIVLAAWAIQFDFVSEFEMAAIFMDDPISFNLIQQLVI